MRALLTVLTLALVVIQPLHALDLEREAREIEAMLIAPCCFTQQVSLHQSPAAEEVRLDVRRRLAAGETREQILHAYMVQYGKRILVEPPAEGFDRVLYLLPPLGLVLTAGLVVLIVRRFTASRPLEARTVAEATTGVQNDRYRAELDEELRDLD